MTHEDKFGEILKKGDRVELVYAGDPHYGRIVHLGQLADVPHVEIELTSHATVPAASVRKVYDDSGNPPKHQSPEARSEQADLPKPDAPPAEPKPTVLAEIQAQEHEDKAAHSPEAHHQARKAATDRNRHARGAVNKAKNAK